MAADKSESAIARPDRRSAPEEGNAEGRFEIAANDERSVVSETEALPPRQSSLADICHRAVLNSHAPAAVLINRNHQCLYSMGPTDRYLRIPPGYATLDLLAMATPALRTRLRLAIAKANTSQPRVNGGRIRVACDGVAVWFNIDVQLLATDGEGLLLVCFLEEASRDVPVPAGTSDDAVRIAQLERDLQATEVELQTAIQNREAAAHEQKAIGEGNQELQSLNEELTALNSQLQEALERQRLTSDDLQNVLYSTNIGTLFLDLDLKIRFFTPAIKALFNVIPGDLGRPLADLHSIATDNELLPDAHKVLAGEALIEREIGAPNAKWFGRRIFPYRAHDGRVEGVVITFADITERKQIAKALELAKLDAERANIAKSRFLAAASHDLRQPLQSLTLLQALLAQSVEGDKPQKLVARLDQTLGAMSGMLNALLDINQIEAGVVEPKPVIFMVADIFDRLRDEFTYMAQTHNLSLHILPSPAVIESDPRLLEQMIRNLLGNALQYTTHGKILLGVRRRGARLRIEVWDTGIGIAKEDLHAIFDEFHQVGNDARERSRGLGLGLSIVQRLGRLLGHDINVRSVPGKGSVFSITVPLLTEVTQAPRLDDLQAEARVDIPSRDRRTIVIVDDDPDVLELLEQLLTGDGHIVRTACDAAAALTLVAGGVIRPEILLTDYNLPNGKDGLELLADLREMLQSNLPAIVLTGDISRETLAKIAAQDCIQLSKPVKPHELGSAIERLAPQAVPSSPQSVPPSVERSAPIAWVVDDDPETRATIRDVLEGDGRFVEDFGSAEAFLEAYRPGAEGCLLVDVFLPGMSGVVLLEKLRARGDNLPAILITGSSDVGLAVDAMRSGACDFIEKPVGRVELLASISQAIDQSRDIRIVDGAKEIAAGHVAGLTTRQREVMDMVLAGHPSKNIAADLGISQRTVENHRAAVMHKMGAKSLPELARFAQAAAERQAV